LCTGSWLAPNSMTLNDLERQNRGFYGFFGNFVLQHKSISFTRWRHTTIVIRSRYRIWHLYITLAWTPQFSAKLLKRNCYRLLRVSWALTQISCYINRASQALQLHVQWNDKLQNFNAYTSMNYEMSATERVNKMRLIYENYTVSYKSFPGAPIIFQEISSISRSCRHPEKGF